MIDTILFVCTGNTCRSSMAKGLFEKIISEDKELESIEVLSAGTNVYFSTGATPEAIFAAKEYGADIENHKSTQLSNELIERADLILTMTENHKLKVLSMNPEANKKTYTLKEFADEIGVNDLDILDPFGMNLDEYKKCAREIHQFLVKAKEKLKRLEG